MRLSGRRLVFLVFIQSSVQRAAPTAPARESDHHWNNDWISKSGRYGSIMTTMRSALNESDNIQCARNNSRKMNPSTNYIFLNWCRTDYLESVWSTMSLSFDVIDFGIKSARSILKTALTHKQYYGSENESDDCSSGNGECAAGWLPTAEIRPCAAPAHGDSLWITSCMEKKLSTITIYIFSPEPLQSLNR